MKTWSYITNPFLAVGSQSRTKAIKLSTFTHGALEARSADPFFGPQFLYYKTLHQALLAEEAEWQSQRGAQKGKTSAFDLLLKELSPGKIYEWDLAVQGIFAKGTPGYIAVFPQGHQPFQTGGKDQRVAAVKALSDSLGVAGAPPGFAAIKASVDAFHTLLTNARSAQTGAISVTEAESDEASVAMVNAMHGLFKVYGSCVVQFFDNLTAIEPIFDLQTLRSHNQTEWVATVNAGETKFVFKRTLEPGTPLRLKNLSSEPVTFFLAAEKNDAPGAQSVTVAGGEEEVVPASQLGNAPVNTFFKAQNQSVVADGHFEIEIL